MNDYRLQQMKKQLQKDPTQQEIDAAGPPPIATDTNFDLDESYTEGVDNYTPSMDELESWFNDSGCPCTGPCECWVEHDGTCPNGYPSQFKSMGLI